MDVRYSFPFPNVSANFNLFSFLLSPPSGVIPLLSETKLIKKFVREVFLNYI